MADRPTDPALLEEIHRRVPVGIFTMGPDGRLTSANPNAQRCLALPDPADGLDLLADPRVRAAGLDGPLRAAIEGTPASIRAVPFAPEPGRAATLDIELVPMPGTPGWHQVLAIVSDVTERLKVQRRAELFYQSFLHSHDVIEVTDRQGVLVDVNPAFERVYGYSRDEVVGLKPRIVRSPKTPDEIHRRMWADLLDPKKGRWAGEIINLDRQGREHPILLSIDAIRNASGEITHFIGVATDLSEQKSFERQVARADRLASIGQLAAGVAHELNTPLANVMLIAESLHRRAPNAWVEGRADALTKQVDAASRIVHGLLDFSRSYPPRVDEFDLASVAAEAVSFARGKQSMDIEVVEHFEVAPLPVRGDRLELLQVFVNLINNAYDAMEGKGTLTISSGVTEGLAEVAVADTGPGIPPSILPRIFEPFFTPKTDGKGTGLGLAICHGIVRAHGGVIDVATDLGRGARFTVRLPLVPGHAPSEPGDRATGRSPVAVDPIG